ncbi:hypothetical protein Droror1_Dr00016616 [Drosera rotundifolia]
MREIVGRGEYNDVGLQVLGRLNLLISPGSGARPGSLSAGVAGSWQLAVLGSADGCGGRCGIGSKASRSSSPGCVLLLEVGVCSPRKRESMWRLLVADNEGGGCEGGAHRVWGVLLGPAKGDKGERGLGRLGKGSRLRENGLG